MPWKTDANGALEVKDGKPIYIYAAGPNNGKEVPFDGDQATSKIHELTEESKGHRLRAEKAEGLLKPFEGLDATAARESIERLSKIDQKKLIDAGQVDQVKQEIAKGYETEITKLKTELDMERGSRRSLLVGAQFKSSPYFVAKGEKQPAKTVLPPAIAESYFGAHCVVKDDNTIVVVRKPGDENTAIYSRTKHGELADFDEAIGILLESHPDKDSIFRGSGAAGSGANPGNAAATDTSGLPLEVQLERAYAAGPRAA